MIDKATVLENKDLNYKSGYVECQCGWRKELGDGFNGHHIDCCPDCTPSLRTRSQRKVTTGSPRGANLTVKLGRFVYFVMSNGIHIQYSADVHTTRAGLTERQADKL